MALHSATIGGTNCAVGVFALYQMTTGSSNCAMGYSSLGHDTTGSGNTAIGTFTLGLNSTGYNNTALGGSALIGNETGSSNTAVGIDTLFRNTGGSSNTAVGVGALSENQASNNCAEGVSALAFNTVGACNTANGMNALYVNVEGNNNTAAGFEALYYNKGNSNTGQGYHALYNDWVGDNNVAIGQLAGSQLQSGSNNIYIGDGGYAAATARAATESGSIRIGNPRFQANAYLAGVFGVTAANGVPVMIASDGHLGVATSSARFKDDIQPMKDASDVLLSLQPVTFRYKKELDSLGTPQFGLVAEQVAKVDPNLVARDDSGQPYTVRYEAVNAMLLNEFLKEHRTVAAQNAQIELLEKRLGEQDKINAEMRAALGAQAEQIQKVNAQLATQQPAARLVSNLQ
jgi:hypothetical protein